MLLRSSLSSSSSPLPSSKVRTAVGRDVLLERAKLVFLSEWVGDCMQMRSAKQGMDWLLGTRVGQNTERYQESDLDSQHELWLCQSVKSRGTSAEKQRQEASQLAQAGTNGRKSGSELA